MVLSQLLGNMNFHVVQVSMVFPPYCYLKFYSKNFFIHFLFPVASVCLGRPILTGCLEPERGTEILRKKSKILEAKVEGKKIT